MFNVQKLKSFLNKFNLSVNKLSTFVEITTNKIGSIGAAIVFSEYIKNYQLIKDDVYLNKFINFYIQNWTMSASQQGQDIFVMFSTKKKRKGKYLEIGGADGFTHSNTFALNKYLGWNGIILEPDNEMFATLKKVRTSDEVLNVALSPSGIEGEFKLRKAGQLSSIIGYEKEDLVSEIRELSTQLQKIKGISLTPLLMVNKFDYFSLDVEGSEIQILQSIKWNKINKPNIITVEHNFEEEVKNEIIFILESQGYQNCFGEYEWLTSRDLWFKYKY